MIRTATALALAALAPTPLQAQEQGRAAKNVAGRRRPPLMTSCSWPRPSPRWHGKAMT